MIIFTLLSGEHTSLAVAELEELFGIKTKKDERIRIAKVNFSDDKIVSLGKRLAYAKFGARLIFSCKLMELEKKLSAVSWSKYCKKDYKVNLIAKHEKSAGYYGGIIWRKLHNPKVNLSNPKTDIRIVLTNSKAYVGILLWENTENFGHRKAHKRPGFLPTSVHPKLARASVNLLGNKATKILDPFCGTGGFLIEAGLMGLKAYGTDIDEKALKACKANLDYFKINCKVIKKDALKLGKTKYLVTDIPYGKSARASIPVSDLKDEFFKVLKKNLTGKAVVILDSKMKIPELKIKKMFSYYIHKSMTKKILLLSA